MYMRVVCVLFVLSLFEVDFCVCERANLVRDHSSSRVGIGRTENKPKPKNKQTTQKLGGQNGELSLSHRRNATKSTCTGAPDRSGECHSWVSNNIIAIRHRRLQNDHVLWTAMRQPDERQRNEQMQLQRGHGQRHRMAQRAEQADRLLWVCGRIGAGTGSRRQLGGVRPRAGREEQLLLHGAVQLVLVRFVADGR